MTYNGWKNYETWNVALWVQNDEFLYALAQRSENYVHFVSLVTFAGWKNKTPDGVEWYHKDLDFPRLDEMIEEMAA